MLRGLVALQELEMEYKKIASEDIDVADDEIDDLRKKMNVLFDLVKANEDSIKKCLVNFTIVYKTVIMTHFFRTMMIM